ncbi:hypothetical protein [Actinomadura sp.]|jgi:hypothetical protein|uniref:hypothetical protein n=1 Tax=Actinomadura sp. TaxID=1989 RepID=UPI0037C87FA6
MTAERGTAGHDEPTPAALRAATARALQETFPGVRVWYGEATGSWWAMVLLRDGPRLVEAPSAERLREEIVNLRGFG